jgi:hypothetical protein
LPGYKHHRNFPSSIFLTNPHAPRLAIQLAVN